jgi:hypothetical protein
LKLADYLPQLGGYAGVGVSGYFYQQITKDSGSGAVLGSFEGMTTGVGPVLSYAYTNFGNKNNDPVFSVGAEVKWLPELSVSNRLEGNIVWLKVVFTCCASPLSETCGGDSGSTVIRCASGHSYAELGVPVRSPVTVNHQMA